MQIDRVEIETLIASNVAMTSELARVVRVFEDGIARGQTNTIRIDGGAMATVFCLAMLIVVIIVVMFDSRSYNDLSKKIDNDVRELRESTQPQIDQLRAWNDVHTKDIARLQAAQQEKH